MTSIEQKLLDKFRDASLNYSMKDNKIKMNSVTIYVNS